MRRTLFILALVSTLAVASLASWVWWGNWPGTGPLGEISDPTLVIVLGGGDSSRTREALRLAHDFPDSPILVTGDGGVHQKELLAKGLNPERLQVEEWATSTIENATLSAPWIEPTQGQIVLVTNDFHGPRSLAVFRSFYPDHDFAVASEASTRPFNRWQTEFRRRERAAALFYLFRYQINCFVR